MLSPTTIYPILDQDIKHIVHDYSELEYFPDTDDDTLTNP